jgi:hypothetical protein
MREQDTHLLLDSPRSEAQARLAARRLDLRWAAERLTVAVDRPSREAAAGLSSAG